MFSLQYERQLELFPFFSFPFLTWAFEIYFILYTLPGYQAQAEVKEPNVVSALRELSSRKTGKQFNMFSGDSVVMGQTQGAVGIQERESCYNMRKKPRR